MPQSKNWYIRRNRDSIKGPFPSGQIGQYLLLGRFVISDEVSVDKKDWHLISTIPHLIPAELSIDTNDEESIQKLAAKKRWADERRGLNQDHDKEERRLNPIQSAHEVNRHNLNKVKMIKQKSLTAIIQVILLVTVIILLAYFAFQNMPDNVISVADCSAKPAPKINWSSCKKSGLQLNKVKLNQTLMNSVVFTGAIFSNIDFSNSNLSYSEFSLAKLNKINFSNSVLMGTIFRRSKLNGIDFRGSDLSYADFTGAILNKTDFKNANLSNSIWIDGRKCAKGSIGRCK